MSEYYEKHEGDLAQAEHTLTAFSEECPTDPAGHLLLSAFCASHGRFADADAHCERTVATVLTNSESLAMARDIRDMEPVLAQWVQALCAAAAHKGELLFRQALAADERELRALLNHQYGQLNNWLGHIKGQLKTMVSQQRPSFVEAARQGLDEVAQRYEQLQEEVLARHEQQRLADYRTELEKQWQARNEALFQLFATSLQSTLGVIGERFAHALNTLWRRFQHIDPYLDNEERLMQEEELMAGLNACLRELSTQLIDARVDEAAERLAQELGLLWRGLDKDEQRHLAIAEAFLHRQSGNSMTAFGGLNLGLAVETSLERRVFRVIRQILQQQAIILNPEEEEFLAPVAKYCNAARDSLTFSLMSSAFSRAVRNHQTGSRKKLDQHISSLLVQLPAGEKILIANHQKQKQRENYLETIRKVRNSCAHPRAQDAGHDLNSAWHGAIGDPDHSFFRYFIAAYLPRQGDKIT